MRRVIALLMATLLGSCADARKPITAAATTAGSGMISPMQDAAVSGAMSTPASSRGLTRRQCGRPSVGPEWTIDLAAPGVTCHGQVDCGTSLLVHCIALPDCDDAGAEGCKSWVRTTFCLFDDCATDADCQPGAQCVCPEQGGDPWCIQDGCDQDSDCAVGQHCRDDDSLQAIGPVQHCTTPNDVCTGRSDCPNPDEACGYDLQARHWSCRSVMTFF